MSQLSQLIERLVASRFEFVLVGGYAAVAHGVSLVTQDVDVCCLCDPENRQDLESALADFRPRRRFMPETDQVTTELSFDTNCGTIDCRNSVSGVGDFEAVKRRSVEVAIPAGKCRVLEIDALIDAKSVSGRFHDWLAVLQLKAIKGRTHS